MCVSLSCEKFSVCVCVKSRVFSHTTQRYIRTCIYRGEFVTYVAGLMTPREHTSFEARSQALCLLTWRHLAAKRSGKVSLFVTASRVSASESSKFT